MLDLAVAAREGHQEAVNLRRDDLAAETATRAEEATDGEQGRIKPRRARKALRLLPLAVILAGLAFGYAMGWQNYLTLDYLVQSRDALKALVAENPVAAPLVFGLIYVAAVAFSFPAASVLTIVGGFLFGWLLAGVVVAFSATLGALILYLAARTAFSDVLRNRLGSRAARLARGFEEDAFGYLLALRLAPIFPFFIVNIAPAFFNVKARTYAAATFIGILPGTFAYAWLGVGIDSVVVAARDAGRDVTLGDLVTPQITLAFLALAVVALIPTVVRKWRGRA